MDAAGALGMSAAVVWYLNVVCYLLTAVSLLWLAVDNAGRGHGWYTALFLLLVGREVGFAFLGVQVRLAAVSDVWEPLLLMLPTVLLAFVATRLAFGRLLFRFVAAKGGLRGAGIVDGARAQKRSGDRAVESA